MHHPDAVKRIRRDFPDDIVSAPEIYSANPVTIGDQYAVGEYTDEWGCVFQSRQAGIIGEVKNPLCRTWNDLDKVRAPEELLSLDRNAVNAFSSATDSFVIAPVFPRPFERLQFIRGTENLLYDLMDRPDGFHTLLSMIHEFNIRQLEMWAKTDIDALFFMDDWGSQQSLLINPQTWRELFGPLYKEYIDIAHDKGKYAFMHSDGYILDILPDLVSFGLDAVNAQIFCMGPEKLGERFRGKLTFWGEIDRQHLLPHGSLKDIDNAVSAVFESLWDNGGVVAQCEFGPGARPENVYRVFETWGKVCTDHS